MRIAFLGVALVLLMSSIAEPGALRKSELKISLAGMRLEVSSCEICGQEVNIWVRSEGHPIAPLAISSDGVRARSVHSVTLCTRCYKTHGDSYGEAMDQARNQWLDKITREDTAIREANAKMINQIREEVRKVRESQERIQQLEKEMLHVRCAHNTQKKGGGYEKQEEQD